jgi:hypothetical protein
MFCFLIPLNDLQGGNHTSNKLSLVYEKVTSHYPSSHYPTIPTPTILPLTFPVIDVLDGYNEIIESEHYLLLVKRAEEINLINNLNA